MKVKRKIVKSKMRITKKKNTNIKCQFSKLKKKKAVKKKVAKKKAVKKKVAKKKVAKKKVAKKKVAKKKVAKKKVAKKTRRRKKKILMEDIYSILNKVQMKKKKVTFSTYMIDAPIVENNIKDADLTYNKIEMKTQVVFTIYPSDTEYDDDIKLDILDDEIPDIDQIFG